MKLKHGAWCSFDPFDKIRHRQHNNPFISFSKALAIAFDHSDEVNALSASTVKCTSFPVGSGKNIAMIVLVLSSENASPTSVTFGSTDFTANKIFTGALSGSISNYTVNIYYLINPSGTQDVTATFGASHTQIRIAALTYSGVDQTTPFGTVSSHNVTSATSDSIALTTTKDNSWIVTFSTPSVPNPTATAPLVTRQSVNTGAADRTTTTAGSYTVAWTFSSCDESMQAVEIFLN